MPMKRRLSKGREFAVSDVATKLFDEMRQCRCSCAAADDWIYDRECAGCKRYNELHAHLWRELRLKLWEWPAVLHDGPSDYDRAPEVWQALEKAASAA